MSDTTTSGDILIGKVLGTYRLLRKIGKGGMGSVYVGMHEGLLKEFAVKVLPKSMADSEEYVERFKREARRAAQLEHPNIVSVVDFGVEYDCYYMAMTLVDGETLRQLLKRVGAMQLGEAFELFAQAVAGVAYAHSRDIIHRDIKPDNLLVNKDGILKIVDFGLARRLEEDVEITRSAQVLGTPLYMPVEQWRGDPVDHRADIYSLGVTLYHMLCGQPPFHKGSAIEILRNRLEDNFPEPVVVRPELPAAVNAFVLKMMAREAKWRQQSIAEVQAELDEIRRGLKNKKSSVPDLWSEADEYEQRDPSGRSSAVPPTQRPSEALPAVGAADPFAMWSEADSPVTFEPTSENAARVSSRRNPVAIPEMSPADYAEDAADSDTAVVAESADDIPRAAAPPIADDGSRQHDSFDAAHFAPPWMRGDDGFVSQHALPPPTQKAVAAESAPASPAAIEDRAEKSKRKPKPKKSRRVRADDVNRHALPIYVEYELPEKPPRTRLYRRFKILVPVSWLAILACLGILWAAPPAGWELQPFLANLTNPAPVTPDGDGGPAPNLVANATATENTPAENVGVGTGNTPGNEPPDNINSNAGNQPGTNTPANAGNENGTANGNSNASNAGNANGSGNGSQVADPNLLAPVALPASWAGGEITGNAELAPGTYVVRQSIVIPAGTKLTLRAGAALYVDPAATITVRGELVAAGSAERNVLITGIANGGAVTPFPGIAVFGPHAVLDFKFTHMRGAKGQPAAALPKWPAVGPRNGGALLAVHAKSVALANCVFAECKAAGAIGGACHLESTPAQISNCRFEGNSAAVGGALAVRGSLTLALQRNVFVDNRADDGGALAIADATIIARDCEFTGNVAGKNGGAIWLDRARIGVLNGTFADNRATAQGGAIFADRTVISADRGEFRGNRAADGGGLALLTPTGDVRLSRLAISGNQAVRHGGAIFAENASLRLAACTVSGHKAGANGGAVCLLGGGITLAEPTGSDGDVSFDMNAARDGGAIFAVDAVIEATRSPFTNNTATSFGGAILLRGEKSCLRAKGVRANGNSAGQAGGAWHLSDGVLMLVNEPASEFTFNRAGQMGGAWFIENGQSGCSATAATFTDNRTTLGENDPALDTAGGALAVRGGALRLFRCTLAKNLAGRGGGIDMTTGVSVTLDTVTLSENRSVGGGGAVSHAGKLLTVYAGLVELNIAGTHAGAIDVHGGGQFVAANTAFKINRAGREGGAVRVANGELRAENCEFIDNHADRGGAIWLGDSVSSAIVRNNTIADNRAKTYGGGIFVSPIAATIEGNQFSHNDAGFWGGGVCIARSETQRPLDAYAVLKTNIWNPELPDLPEAVRYLDLND